MVVIRGYSIVLVLEGRCTRGDSWIICCKSLSNIEKDYKVSTVT